jgi:hypothetical protein
LRKATAYLERDHEMLMEILEIGENQEEEQNSKSLYLAMHYQFKAKLAARYLDKESCQ